MFDCLYDILLWCCDACDCDTSDETLLDGTCLRVCCCNCLSGDQLELFSESLSTMEYKKNGSSCSSWIVGGANLLLILSTLLTALKNLLTALNNSNIDMWKYMFVYTYVIHKCYFIFFNVSSGASFVKSICISTTNWCLSSVGLVGCLSSPYITPSKTVKMSKKFQNITTGMINV